MNVKVKCGDTVQVHIVGVISDYLTACGLDGNDNSWYVEQENLGSTNEKVNCAQCIKLWSHFRKVKPSRIDTSSLADGY